jgi:hypothetical protein
LASTNQMFYFVIYCDCFSRVFVCVCSCLCSCVCSCTGMLVVKLQLQVLEEEQKHY